MYLQKTRYLQNICKTLDICSGTSKISCAKDTIGAVIEPGRTKIFYDATTKSLSRVAYSSNYVKNWRHSGKETWRIYNQKSGEEKAATSFYEINDCQYLSFSPTDDSYYAYTKLAYRSHILNDSV